MARILKIVLSDFVNESRDRREIACLIEQGHDAIVMAKSPINEYKVIYQDGYEVHFLPVDTKKIDGRRSIFKTTLTVLKWVKYARKIEADCISCHDLIALFIGWLSTFGLSKKPLLVYDSHEFEIGRNTEGKRSKLAHYIIPKAEKFLMNRCAFSIMVNDSIADEVQKIHGLKKRPIVVRNIPKYWEIDSNVCQSTRQELLGSLYNQGIFVLMYHGGIMKGRGIETLLAAVQKTEKTIAVILGNGEIPYIEELKEIAEQLHISQRVIFHPAVEIDILWQYVGAADVGFTITPNTCINHYYMLPNKLFENIQAETPLIASNFPEIAKIINEYDIGLLVDPKNVDEIVEAIEKMRTNKKLYNKFKSNLKQAKEELCWENERKALEEAYTEVLS